MAQATLRRSRVYLWTNPHGGAEVCIAELEPENFECVLKKRIFAMAKMLERPVPEGSRSVSWPWYHHVLTNELTTEARNVLVKYSKIAPRNVESHIYSIVSLPSLSLSLKADGIPPR